MYLLARVEVRHVIPQPERRARLSAHRPGPDGRRKFVPQLSGGVFGPDAVPEEVAAFNTAMAERFGDLPDIWDVGIDQARSGGLVPLQPPSPRAYDVQIGAGLSLHVVPSTRPRGVLMHIHGGGFILGGAAHQDALLERMAD